MGTVKGVQLKEMVLWSGDTGKGVWDAAEGLCLGVGGVGREERVGGRFDGEVGSRRG